MEFHVARPFELLINHVVHFAPGVDQAGSNNRQAAAFFDIPGQCTIKIFTEAGELIETIEHTDGSGDQLWNLTTSSNQLIVSGIYIAVIQDHDTGDHVVRKFVVIR